MRAFSFAHTRCLVNFAAKSRRRASIKPRRLHKLKTTPSSNGILTARAVFWAAARAHYSRAVNKHRPREILLVFEPRGVTYLACCKCLPREILLQLADFDLYAAFCVGEAYGSSAAVLAAANFIIDRAFLQALFKAVAARVATAEDRLAI